MIKNLFSAFVFSLFLVANSFALVLCAPKGAAVGSVVEGGQVVIRSTCNASETTLRPFELFSNGDAAETILNNKTATIGANSTITVGANQTETVGLSSTNTIGATNSLIVGGDLPFQFD